MDQPTQELHLGLADKYQTAKVQAMSLLSAQPPTLSPPQGGPTGDKLPPVKRRKRAD
jgi:hypothetical protein